MFVLSEASGNAGCTVKIAHEQISLKRLPSSSAP